MGNPGLLRFLSREQVQSAVNELLQDLGCAQNVHDMAQLLETLDPESCEVSTISGAVERSVISSLNDREPLDMQNDILGLLVKLPSATDSVLTHVTSTVLAFLQARKLLVLPPQAVEIFTNTFAVTSTIEVSSELSLVYLLSFLEKLYSLQNVGVTQQLDKLVILLLSVNDEDVTAMATKVLRWRDTARPTLQSFVWLIIPLLETSPSVHQITAGLILWLRFLISTSKQQLKTMTLDSMIQSEQYWQFIQIGLTSSTHEHRKFCLSILKLSIQQLHSDVDNKLITFSIAQRDELEEDWKKFCTLYEIVGVDTALNQAIAAHADIVQLLSPTSHIKPSWGMALLCTGFKGNMEAVRKYSLELMYSVPKENLCIFAHEFLTSIFLKYALEGFHFQVKKSGDSYQCAYGVKLEMFIANLIKSLKKDRDGLSMTCRNIISLLASITTVFAPVRLYLTSGLLKGLKGLAVIDASMIKDLYKLFESTAEDDVCEITLQTVHLRLLKHTKGDIPLLLEALTRFVQYNGYDIFIQNIEFFFDFISTYNKGDTIAYQRREVEFQIVYYYLFDEFTISDEFLKELAKSRTTIDDAKIAESLSLLLGDLVQGKTEEYEKTKHLMSLSIFRNSWSTVDLKPLFESLLMDFTLDKLEFFSCIFFKVSEVSDVPFFQFEQVEELYKVIRTFKPDFKSKDIISSSFINVIHSFIQMNSITEEQLTRILCILQFELRNGLYLGYKSTCQVLQFLFKQYDTVDLITSMEILEAIWNQISAERLILSQGDMHLCFIETLFDQKLLKDSINNEFNAKLLHKIGLDLISSSQMRRCIQPCLSTKIAQYQRAFPQEFEMTLWLVDLIIGILVSVQDDSNVFKIKNVIAEKFNKEFSFGEDLYEQVYGVREVAAKCNMISVLSKGSQQFCDEYWRAVLSDKFSFVTAKKKMDGSEEIQRVYAFASLLLICKTISAELLDIFVKDFLPRLEKESSPWIRSYMEWIVALDLIKNYRNRDELFALLEDQGKPTLVTSVERIAFLVGQKLEGDEAVGYFDSFTKHLIPNCASNKPLIRHFSNSLILSLYPEIQSKGLKLPVDGIVQCLYEEAKKSEITGKYRTGDAMLWDAERDFNLISIFGGVLSRTSPRGFEVITMGEFKKYIAADLPVEIGVTKDARWTGQTAEESTEIPTTVESSPLQTKSGAWLSVLDIDQNVRCVKRSDLIVVSSLVDKPPNLGGICRLCDVLGAGMMTVDDLRVKNHPQFKNVSVTADYWMPIEEVKIQNITVYMRQKKREGYTLIGLEQTDQSVVLGTDTKFPQKSLFLLGREAEGIPGELLAELDYCVEIRQVGVIRSMNIQTATAVLVHAYSASVRVCP